MTVRLEACVCGGAIVAPALATPIQIRDLLAAHYAGAGHGAYYAGRGVTYYRPEGPPIAPIIADRRSGLTSRGGHAVRGARSLVPDPRGGPSTPSPYIEPGYPPEPESPYVEGDTK